MDLLATFQMDELPEHQTKTAHLMARHPEFSEKLGFDACCTCGSRFSPCSTILECDDCKRVKYCSESCRKQDASASTSIPDNADEEEEQALGHSSVICALLRLCDSDEAIDNGESLSGDAKLSDARDRVQSEYESYPATIANVIDQGPCFQKVLQKCSRRDNSSNNLKIHIVGASLTAELWNYHERGIDISTVWEAYAEAFAELSDRNKFDAIELYLIGPDCPKENIKESIKICPLDTDGQAGELVVRTFCSSYSPSLLEEENIAKPDVVVLFNPGFTCPDYDWIEALSCIENGTPFLITSNTELEGIADCQFLLEHDIVTSVPIGLADMLGVSGNRKEDEDSFFAENPFSGSRVRQSGTMANDLFVKNRWMLGSILRRETAQPPNKKQVTGSRNTKAGNPALI